MRLTIDDFKKIPCEHEWVRYIDSNHDDSIIYENIEWVFVNIKDPKKLLKLDKIKFENGYYVLKKNEENNNHGVVIVVHKYDYRGNRIVKENYDKDGKLKNYIFGIAKYVYKYDEKGDKILQEFYDEKGDKIG